MEMMIRLETTTHQRYEDYRATAEDEYARSVAASGAMPMKEAWEKAAADYTRLLPDGLATLARHLFVALDMSDSSVCADLRRAGCGLAITRAAEHLCRERGVVAIGHNVAARALYEQEGFEVMSVQMRERLT